ncbi:NADP-dependent oxidoreductase [Halalkalicoccus jeotgali]|nr:NADP-dependent oxidoreductase [Halalkalicoccus jeotgali]
MSDSNRQWILASRPEGKPTEENFELVESERPEPDANEVLVRTRYLSVDPYMRGRMREGESYADPWAVGEPMQAGVVGEVEQSNHDDFEAGDVVAGNLQWAEYSIALGSELTPVDSDLAPISTALGVLGMPGRTAYFGTLEVAEPKPGETMVVSGAAGAVGSVVGQIARMAGARVVGIAGSERKCEWLTDDLDFNAAINYNQEDVHEALSEACPEGIDAYFDNVGGEITDAVFANLNVDARVAVCGQIALYNAEELPTGPRKLATLIEKRARVQGLLVSDFAPRFEAATERLGQWVSEDELHYEETITEGFENAPEAFIGLFEGENIGKQLVEVTEDVRAAS